jgi:hypothetical protein
MFIDDDDDDDDDDNLISMEAKQCSSAGNIGVYRVHLANY